MVNISLSRNEIKVAFSMTRIRRLRQNESVSTQYALFDRSISNSERGNGEHLAFNSRVFVNDSSKTIQRNVTDHMIKTTS